MTGADCGLGSALGSDFYFMTILTNRSISRFSSKSPAIPLFIRANWVVKVAASRPK